MRRRHQLSLIALVAILAGGLAGALSHAFAQLPWGHPANTISSGACGGYQGPGDIKSGAIAYWGFRAYTCAFALAGGSSAVLTRASDSTTKTITVLSNGDFDAATAATFCNATTCTFTWIDQTNHGFNALGHSNTVVPGYQANCIGSASCGGWVRATGNQLTASLVPAPSQPFTTIATSIRTGTFGSFQFLVVHGDAISGIVELEHSGSNQVGITAGTGVFESAANNTWHILQVVWNGSSSIFSVDNSQNTVNPGTRNPGSEVDIGGSFGFGGDYMTGNNFEVLIYPSAASSAELSALYSNSHSYCASKGGTCG